MKRILFIAFIALTAAVSANAQRVSYKEIKKDYSYKDYVAMPEDPYSPGWSSAVSFFAPGVGQLMMREPVRGILFLVGESVCASIIENSAESIFKLAVYDADGTITGFSDQDALGLAVVGVIGGALAGLGVSIWSSIDAKRIAKVKDMYYQDITGRRSAIEMDLKPNLTFTPTPGGALKPAPGMSFCLNF